MEEFPGTVHRQISKVQNGHGPIWSLDNIKPLDWSSLVGRTTRSLAVPCSFWHNSSVPVVCCTLGSISLCFQVLHTLGLHFISSTSWHCAKQHPLYIRQVMTSQVQWPRLGYGMHVAQILTQSNTNHTLMAWENGTTWAACKLLSWALNQCQGPQVLERSQDAHAKGTSMLPCVTSLHMQGVAQECRRARRGTLEMFAALCDSV